MSPSPPPTPTPVVYPVDDLTKSEAEREYLRQLAKFAAEQDLTEDNRGYVRDISIAFTVFAAAFIALRFFARWRQAAYIGIDDWLIVASFVLLVANMIMNLMLVKQGLGLHSGALTVPELQRLDKTVLGAEILYVTGVNLYKISLLFFYFRVFPVRSVRLGGYICGGISTAWNLACILAATFQCTPREKLWMPWLDGTCINLFLTQLCISIPSILCDIAILCLPMPHVIHLKTNLWQRILLMFIFLLGSYVVFTSVYRFRVFLTYTPDDIPYTLADGCAWNVIEISSGIVSACLPTLGPLVRDLFKSAWPASSSGSKHPLSQNAKGGSAIITIGGTARKNHASGGKNVTLDSKGSRSRWNQLESDEELPQSRDDLELVPKHVRGKVEVTIHTTRGGPRRGSRGDDDGESGGMGADDFELGHTGRGIRQRRDVEWTVEERRSSGVGA